MSFLDKIFGAPNQEQDLQTPPPRAVEPTPVAPKGPQYYTGDLYEGLLTWTTDPVIGRPGYYALEDDGKTIRKPHVMLTWVDLDPRDEENLNGHYVVADLNESYYSHLPESHPSRVVDLAANTTGGGGVSVAS